jgi:tripartite-type tricarboxylate transporter receptor subunit TctC
MGALGAFGLLALRAPAASAAEAFPRQVTLMVAGPAGGTLDQVALRMIPALTAHLPAGTALTPTEIGGIDGVTGANQFAAEASMDGSMALLVPGAAPLAWLAGDSRVHFDPARWLPIMARTTPAFVVTRGPGTIRPGKTVRVASGGALTPALAAMLAVDLLGAQVRPVYGLADGNAALNALSGGTVDAVLLHGAHRLDQLNQTHPGLAAQFALGMAVAGGTMARDTLAPNVPTLLEYARSIGRDAPQGTKYAVWCCAAGAAQLQHALVLPSLTPASAVALWRDAADQALTPSDLASSVNTVLSSAASVLLRALCPGGAALLELRTWIAERLGWQPG